MNRELLKGNINLMILSILKEGDTYGYEIMKLVKKKTKGSFELKEGTMYIALKRLESNGLVESYWKKIDLTPKRKYYKLTQLGSVEYLNLKNEWEHIVLIMKDFIGRGDLS